MEEFIISFSFFQKNILINWRGKLEQNHLRYKSVIDAFGASKEVKVGGLEKTFIKNFSEPSKIFALTNPYLELLGHCHVLFLKQQHLEELY